MSDLLGMIVVAVDGVTGEPNFVGECFGYMGEPTYMMTKEDGTRATWAQSITRVATPDEELAYWRNRAMQAEKMRGHP